MIEQFTYVKLRAKARLNDYPAWMGQFLLFDGIQAKNLKQIMEQTMAHLNKENGATISLNILDILNEHRECYENELLNIQDKVGRIETEKNGQTTAEIDNNDNTSDGIIETTIDSFVSIKSYHNENTNIQQKMNQPIDTRSSDTNNQFATGLLDLTPKKSKQTIAEDKLTVVVDELRQNKRFCHRRISKWAKIMLVFACLILLASIAYLVYVVITRRQSASLNARKLNFY